MCRFAPILTLICLLAGAVAAEPPRIFQSVRGDVVQLSVAPSAPCAIPCPARLCLSASPGFTEKGFSLGAEGRPSQGCRNLAPVLQRLTLWSAPVGGALVPVVSAPLDLRDKAGAVIWIEWLHAPASETLR